VSELTPPLRLRSKLVVLLHLRYHGDSLFAVALAVARRMQRQGSGVGVPP
jgi:hypothetical protein